MFKSQISKMYRNKAKRAYANQFLAWMMSGYPEEREPEAKDLSYMGAQAVRMDLHRMYDNLYPRKA